MTSLFSTFVIAAVIAVQSAQSLNLSPIENTPVPRAPEAPKLFAVNYNKKIVDERAVSTKLEFQAFRTGEYFCCF